LNKYEAAQDLLMQNVYELDIGSFSSRHLVDTYRHSVRYGAFQQRHAMARLDTAEEHSRTQNLKFVLFLWFSSSSVL